MADIGRVELLNRDLRENFKVAKIALGKEFKVDPNKIPDEALTQGFIRTPVNILTNVSNMKFPISTLDVASVQNAPATPLQNLVDSVDAFVAGQMGYYLQYISYTTNYQNFDFTVGNSWMPITYPSPYYNNVSTTNLYLGTSLFWLGYMTIQVNDLVLYKKWDLMRHLMAPRTQATPAVGITPSPQLQVFNNFDGGNDSFYPMEPLPVFSGSRQNLVQIFLPSNVPATIGPFNNSTYNVNFIMQAVIHFRGVNCQNGSKLGDMRMRTS